MRLSLAHFLPLERKKRAHLLSHPTLLGYVFLVTSLFVTAHFLSVRFPAVLGYASNITVNDLLNYTNSVRQEHNQKSLKLDSALSQAAHNKAVDMLENDYWAHISPTGTEPWDFINSSGYVYIYAGENLARDFSNSKSVVDAWMDSPSHRDNLLGVNYDDIGFAVVNGKLNGEETTLVVQMFGRQKNPQYTASIDKEAFKTQQVENISVEEEPNKQVLATSQPVQIGSILPAIDLTVASKGFSISLGAFLTLLFGLDIWYVKKRGILRMSGNTVAHFLFLLLALVGIWYASVGRVM